jgi:hypothetical protein
LQLALDGGLVAVAALVALVIDYARLMIRSPEWRWHAVLLVFILGHNMAEVSLASPHALLWALFLASRTRAALDQAEVGR